MFRDVPECSMFLILSTARSYLEKFSWRNFPGRFFKNKIDIPLNPNTFSIGEGRVTYRGSKLTCSLWRTKLTNLLEYSLGQQQFELSTGTWSGRAPWRRNRRCFGSGPHRKALVTLVMNKACDFLYPIFDLTKNSISYLWPHPLINTLFQTCLIIIFLVYTDVKGIVKGFYWWCDRRNDELKRSFF